TRPCIRTAFTLYGGILDAIADQGYTVLHRRAVVSRRRRAVTAAAGVVQIVGARRRAARTGGAPVPGSALLRAKGTVR
ncbi:phytoene/squalene synthase family protein, partial [Streptomyces flaveolus]